VLTLSLILKISAITWYEINQSYISAELCEEKSKLDNECKGSCQLTQRLRLTEQSSSDQENPFSNEKLEILSFVLYPNESENYRTFLLSKLTFSRNEPKVRNPFIDEVFHPPTS